MFEQYKHHDVLVWVKSDLKGSHRIHCLCYKCKLFYPEDRLQNCSIANVVYRNCIDYDIVTPVWECSNFQLNKRLI